MGKEKREVQNLLMMWGGAVFFAFIIVICLLYYFGSSGTYLLRNVLVSPEVLEQISFSDFDSKTGKRAPFVFNKIEFVRADSSGKKWGRFAVSPQSYAEFYDLVENERSLPQITDEQIQQFEWIAPSTLTIFVQAHDNDGTHMRGDIFQQVEFIDQGDLFRVQLRRGKIKRKLHQEWIYFRVPGIYGEVVKLFAPTLESP